MEYDGKPERHYTVSAEERTDTVFAHWPGMRFKANSKRNLCMSASHEVGRTAQGPAPSGLIHARVSFLEKCGTVNTKGLECGNNAPRRLFSCLVTLCFILLPKSNFCNGPSGTPRQRYHKNTHGRAATRKIMVRGDVVYFADQNEHDNTATSSENIGKYVSNRSDRYFKSYWEQFKPECLV